MKKFVIIVAGGSGSRMKSALPKQFMLLNGLPVLMHTLQKFNTFDAALSLILVLPEAQLDDWQILCSVHNFRIPHQLISGGATRFHSVQKGLSLVADDALVAIHDGVRPLVSNQTIQAVFETAQTKGNAIPSIAVNDSLRKVSGEKSNSVLRSDFRLIQTPQGFLSTEIKKAYRQEFQDSFTDCASVLEAAGSQIHLVEGNVENIKLTTPIDFIIAESFLKIA